ncbi:hypothetical protein TNCV_1950611 [Trichonephila clavipes]|nr:hypothetical protein TNCV_1950611 [Trichonephila clavipes]
MNENKIDGERQRAGASAQNGWRRGTEANMRRSPKNGEGLHAEIVQMEIEVVSPSIVPSWNFADLNRTVTCMVLKANDRRTSCPCHDEFRGPRSD